MGKIFRGYLLHSLVQLFIAEIELFSGYSGEDRVTEWDLPTCALPLPQNATPSSAGSIFRYTDGVTGSSSTSCIGNSSNKNLNYQIVFGLFVFLNIA